MEGKVREDNVMGGGCILAILMFNEYRMKNI